MCSLLNNTLQGVKQKKQNYIKRLGVSFREKLKCSLIQSAMLQTRKWPVKFCTDRPR